MTFTDDFVPEDELEESGYPEVFGITFTPVIGGIIAAVLGLAGAAYLGFTQVMPAWNTISTVEVEISKTEAEVRKKQKTLEDTSALEAELEQAKLKKNEVIALLSSEESLDTLLLDINRFIEQRQAQLVKYQPGLEITPVDDGSLGTALNGQMKRQSIIMEIEGTFDQTQSVIRNLERLQSALLVVKDLEAQVLQLAVTGDLNHDQLNQFKKALIEKVGISQGLTERLFEPGRVTYEMDYTGGVEALRNKLARTRIQGFISQVVSAQAGQITLDVRISH